ncbi:MAG: hypothetical protein ACYS22_00840 [Planctomycetota bacterium]
MIMRWLAIVPLLLLTLQVGCSRHLLIESLPADPAAQRAEVFIHVQPSYGPAAEGLLVEIFAADDEDGPVVARLTTESEPRVIPDLPPGEYLVRVHAEAIDAGLLETRFEVEPGQRIAIAYEDNERTKVAVGEFFKGVGVAIGVGAIVAAEITLRAAIIVLSCGCAGWH